MKKKIEQKDRAERSKMNEERGKEFWNKAEKEDE